MTINSLSDAAEDESKDEVTDDEDHHDQTNKEPSVGCMAVGVYHYVTRKIVLLCSRGNSIKTFYLSK